MTLQTLRENTWSWMDRNSVGVFCASAETKMTGDFPSSSVGVTPGWTLFDAVGCNGRTNARGTFGQERLTLKFDFHNGSSATDLLTVHHSQDPPSN